MLNNTHMEPTCRLHSRSWNSAGRCGLGCVSTEQRATEAGRKESERRLATELRAARPSPAERFAASAPLRPRATARSTDCTCDCSGCLRGRHCGDNGCG